MTDSTASYTTELNGFKPGELEDLMSRVRSLEDYKALPEKVRILVGEGALRLKKIDILGLQVENLDKENLKGSAQSKALVNETFQEKIANELNEIKRSHRSSMHGTWFDQSLNQLVRYAGSDDSREMELAGNAVLSLPDNYIRRLSNAGEYYLDLLKSVYPGDERVEMTNYCTRTRPESIVELKSTSTKALPEILTALREVKKEQK